MPIDRANDPTAFREFLDSRLADAPAGFILDDALAEWDAENPAEDDPEETLRAIQEGLAEVDADPGQPFEEFDREFRARHALS